MTCVGFSGPLDPSVSTAVKDHGIRAVAVLSGNRNYEGRAHPLIRASFLASPPLVVAYALAGSILTDLTTGAIGEDAAGAAVYLSDLWPDPREIRDIIDTVVDPALFARSYADLFEGTPEWRRIAAPSGADFAWDARSAFIRRPPLFDDVPARPEPLADIHGARVLAMYGRHGDDRARLTHGPRPRRLARRAVPGIARYRREGFRQLCRAQDQPRRHAARHVREPASRQRAHARRGGRPDTPHARRRDDDDLRRGAALSTRERPAGGHRREGLRRRFLAGLVREGAARPRRARGDRAVVRAHLSCQPRRRRRVAARALRRRHAGVTRHRRHRVDRHPRDRRPVATPHAGRNGVHAHRRRGAPGTPVARLDTEEVDCFRHGGLLPRLLRRRISI